MVESEFAEAVIFRQLADSKYFGPVFRLKHLRRLWKTSIYRFKHFRKL